jgi:hypothetical protein
VADLARFRFRRIFFIAAGGAANTVLLLFRAMVWMELGFLPECWRFLGVDFSSDPPVPPADLLPREIPPAVWDHAAYGPSEVRLLELPEDCAALAERVEAGAPDVSWIGAMVPPAVLAQYSSGEALQLGAFTRLALAWAADDLRPGTGKSWLGLMEDGLASLAPGGEAEHHLVTRRRVTCQDADPALMVLVGGACGGTGNGALLPLAIAARSLGAAAGQPVHVEALLLTGHYRQRDGQEAHKLAIAAALEKDIEHAVAGGNARFSLPLGSGRELTCDGRLFDAVYREEATGRLEHNFAAAAAQAADTMLFRYAAASAAAIQRSRNNIAFMPRLMKLTSTQGSRPNHA